MVDTLVVVLAVVSGSKIPVVEATDVNGEVWRNDVSVAATGWSMSDTVAITLGELTVDGLDAVETG